MKIGAKVVNKSNGKIGYVIRDTFGCCDDTEVLVVYEKTNMGLGTNYTLLEEIPQTLPHIPEPKGCGAGRGEECCIFLTVGGNGFNCERYSELRDNLIFKKMTSKRNPKEVYPACMIF